MSDVLLTGTCTGCETDGDVVIADGEPLCPPCATAAEAADA